MEITRSKMARTSVSPRRAGITGPAMYLHSFVLGFILGCVVFCVLGLAGVWRDVLCLECRGTNELEVWSPVHRATNWPPMELYLQQSDPPTSRSVTGTVSSAKPNTSTENSLVTNTDFPTTWSGCPDRPLHIVVLILASPRGVMRRNSIRGTWQRSYSPHKLRVTSKFLVGTRNLPKARLHNLTNEDNKFGDMLLLPELVDSYSNLSRKVLMGLRWAHHNLQFDYLIKTDDDSYVRLEELEAVVRRLDCEQRLYWGYFVGHAVPEATGKWAETQWFNCPHYLPYAMGGGYVLSSHVVHLLMKYSQRLKCYSNEDVTVGSWLAPFRLVRKHDLRFNVESVSRGCSNNFIVTHKERLKTYYEKFTSLVRNHTLCQEEREIRPAYQYNWDVSPMECCLRTKGIPVPPLDAT